MVVNVGFVFYNVEEILIILRYVNRVKNIKNKLRVNEDFKDVFFREF